MPDKKNTALGKIEVDVALDGKPDLHMMSRSPMKLANAPHIVVAIPIGGKQLSSVLNCPECDKKYNVSSGFVTPAVIPAVFMLHQMNWVAPLNVAISYMFKTGMLSAEARQVMTQEAIRTGAEFIFYVDDDTLIPPMGLYTLYNFMRRNPDAGAVSGVYTTRETPNEPLLYTAHGVGCDWDIPMGPNATPVPIFGAGAGCLLARVSAIKEWQDEHPGEAIWSDARAIGAEGEGSVMWGHDIKFCRNLNSLQKQVFAHGAVLCDHYDMRTNKVFSVPEDAPGLQKGK